jgi:hypothetical protein
MPNWEVFKETGEDYVTPNNFVEKFWETMELIWEWFKNIVMKLLNKEKND